jgi:hypothetical protein
MAQGGGSMSASTDPAKAATYFSDNMSSTTPQNYLTDTSNQLAADIRGHNAKGTTMDNALLAALAAYQKTAEPATVTSVATTVLSTIA